MAFSQSLKDDVKSQVGSIFSWNAPNAIGYLFTLTKDGRKINTGMFCDRVSEIDPARWDGLYLYNKNPEIPGKNYNLNDSKQIASLERLLNLSKHKEC